MSHRNYTTEKIDQDGNLEVKVVHDYPMGTQGSHCN